MALELTGGLGPIQAFAVVGAAGVGAQWLAWRFRLPAIVLMLAAGLFLGPVTGIFVPARDIGDIVPPMISLAVAVILFEGGLTLSFKKLADARPAVRRLVYIGAPLGWALSSLTLVLVAGLGWQAAIVLGGIMIVTGPTVIAPLLRQAKLTSRPAQTLQWEGIVNDPIGALVAVVALEIVLVRNTGATWDEALAQLILGTGFAAAIGVVAGYLLVQAFRRGWVPEYMKVPLLFVAVLGVFAGADSLLHESGLLAVTVMGLVIANADLPSYQELHRFKEHATILLVSGVFILLAAGIEFDTLAQLNWLRAGLFVAAVVLVARPLTVMISLIGTNLPMKERWLIALTGPRGWCWSPCRASLPTGLWPRASKAARRSRRWLSCWCWRRWFCTASPCAAGTPAWPDLGRKARPADRRRLAVRHQPVEGAGKGRCERADHRHQPRPSAHRAGGGRPDLLWRHSGRGGGIQRRIHRLWRDPGGVGQRCLQHPGRHRSGARIRTREDLATGAPQGRPRPPRPAHTTGWPDHRRQPDAGAVSGTAGRGLDHAHHPPDRGIRAGRLARRAQGAIALAVVQNGEMWFVSDDDDLVDKPDVRIVSMLPPEVAQEIERENEAQTKPQEKAKQVARAEAEAVKRGEGNGSVAGGEARDQADELREELKDDPELVETEGDASDGKTPDEGAPQPDPDADLPDEDEPAPDKDNDKDKGRKSD